MASLPNAGQPSPRVRVRDLTLRAGDIARTGCELLARELPRNPAELLVRIRQYEEELDHLNRTVNETIATELAGSDEAGIRELLTCLKFLLELERIGDLQ